MATMRIKDILRIVPSLSPRVSVMFRADHGIGKSSIARQIWQILCRLTGIDYEFIDRRLSQMEGGDLMGLPSITDGGSTQWNPPDWYKRACDVPCIVFLDELNRAKDEVTNGAFQIVLDHEMAGYKLHPDTRVYTAVNLDAKYNVHQIDPAMLNRFAVIDVLCHIDDWVTWARDAGVHTDYIDWLQQNSKWLTPPDEYDTTQVHPTPRSHEMAAKEIDALLRAGSAPNGAYDLDLIRQVCSMFTGDDAALAFCTYLKAEFQFTGADLLERYTAIRTKIKLHRIDILQNALEKLVDELKNYEELGKVRDGELDPAMAERHGKNIEQLMIDMPPELRPMYFQKLADLGTDAMAMIVSTHKYFAKATCEGFGVPIGRAGVGILPRIHGMEPQKKSA